MRIKNNSISGGHYVDNVAAERWDGMRGWRDRRHHSERSVFFERDAMIAAAPVRVQPFDPRHQLENLQLLNLVIQPPDLRLLQFNSAPFGRISFRQSLNNF